MWFEDLLQILLSEVSPVCLLVLLLTLTPQRFRACGKRCALKATKAEIFKGRSGSFKHKGRRSHHEEPVKTAVSCLLWLRRIFVNVNVWAWRLNISHRELLLQTGGTRSEREFRVFGAQLCQSLKVCTCRWSWAMSAELTYVDVTAGCKDNNKEDLETSH